MAFPSLTAANVAANTRFGSLITKIEVQAATAGTWADLGKINEGSLKLTPVSTKASGHTIQVGYKVELTGNMLGISEASMTYVNNMLLNDHDVRVTDANGFVFTFDEDNLQLAVGLEESGDFENPIKITLAGEGYMTAKQYCDDIVIASGQTCS